MFFELLQVTLGRREGLSRVPSVREWEEVEALAEKQGVDGLLLSGIERMVSPLDGEGNHRGPGFIKDGISVPVPMIPLEVKLQWIGAVMQMEAVHKDYLRALASLAGFYNDHGLKMMVVKGYACALDWPRPEHRPTGDIDIWLFGKQRIADEVLERETGVEVDRSHHHHTVFEWHGFSVENHYDFINVHHHRSHAEMEKTFKELGQDDEHFVELNGERVYLPSPDLHALFLLKHAMMHFAATEITVKNLLDWGFFVQAHGEEVDWVWLQETLGRYGMKELFHIFNAICVEDLGFDAGLFPQAEVDTELKERVLAEILDPEIPNDKPSKVLVRAVWKLRRWKANEWKHRLCYSDSMWSAFWSGVWNHMLKPSSI